MNSTNTPDTQAQSSPVSATLEQVIDPIFGRSLTRSVASGGELSLEHVSVGILTALPKEFAAVCSVLECVEDVIAIREGGDNVYRLGVVKSKGKWGLVVAVALLNEMGNVSAATRVANMLSDCQNLKELIVCGIAGAVPAPSSPPDHVRVGDIVVSTDGVLQYDFGKQYAKGFEIKGQPYQPSYRLNAVVRLLQASEALGQRPWEKYIENGLKVLPENYRRPEEDADMLREAVWGDPKRIIENVVGWSRAHFGGKPKYSAIQHPGDNDRIINQPRIFYGLIASASRVLKDQVLREQLRKEYNIKAVEMEAAGAAHACFAKSVGYFVVRGTCDYCNADKNKVWQSYAALAAAAYTRSVLEGIDVRVFTSTPKILTVVPITAAMEPIADTQETFSEESVEYFLSESDRAASSFEELKTGNLNTTSPRTSEAIKDIPKLVSHGRKDLTHSPVSAKFAVKSADIFATGFDRRSPIAKSMNTVVADTPSLDIKDHNGKIVQPTQRERQLLTTEGERFISQLKELIEKWEFEGAYGAATFVETWIAKNDTSIAPDLAGDIYAMLARVEAIKVKRNRKDAEAIDLKLARYYLSKAKDAYNR